MNLGVWLVEPESEDINVLGSKETCALIIVIDDAVVDPGAQHNKTYQNQVRNRLI